MRRLGFLLLASLLASVASAQNPAPNAPTLQIYVEDPGDIFVPGANATTLAHLTYTWPAGSAPQPHVDQADPTSSSFEPTAITFAPVAKPSWADNVSFDPPVVFVEFGKGGDQASKTVKVILHVARDAEAGKREPLTIKATAAPNGGVAGAEAVSPENTFRPGTVPRVSVAPAKNGTAVLPGGRAVPVAFVVTNTGNGEVTAKLNVTVRPEDSMVEFPPTVTLARNASATIDVMLTLPWTYGEAGELTLEATPVAGDAEGKTATASLEIDGQSAIPGLEPLAVLALVGLLALLRRR